MRGGGISRDNRATAALEFALVMPVFLLLLLGAIEYGRMIWTWQALQAAAGVTARCVAIGSNACPAADSYAKAVAQAFGIGSPTVLPSQTTTACSGQTGVNMEQVTLTLAFSSPAAKLLPWLGGTLTASACYPI